MNGGIKKTVNGTSLLVEVCRRQSRVALVTAVIWWSLEVRRPASSVALVTAVIWWSKAVCKRESRVALVTAVLWWSKEVRSRESRVALRYSSNLVEHGGTDTLPVSCSTCYSSHPARGAPIPVEVGGRALGAVRGLLRGGSVRGSGNPTPSPDPFFPPLFHGGRPGASFLISTKRTPETSFFSFDVALDLLKRLWVSFGAPTGCLGAYFLY